MTPERLERAKRHLVHDAAWATLAGSLYGGVVLVGFAVALGASPMLVGLLAAIPFLAQVAQVARCDASSGDGRSSPRAASRSVERCCMFRIRVSQRR